MKESTPIEKAIEFCDKNINKTDSGTYGASIYIEAFKRMKIFLQSLNQESKPSNEDDVKILHDKLQEFISANAIQYNEIQELKNELKNYKSMVQQVFDKTLDESEDLGQLVYEIQSICTIN